MTGGADGERLVAEVVGRDDVGGYIGPVDEWTARRTRRGYDRAGGILVDYGGTAFGVETGVEDGFEHALRYKTEWPVSAESLVTSLALSR